MKYCRSFCDAVWCSQLGLYHTTSVQFRDFSFVLARLLSKHFQTWQVLEALLLGVSMDPFSKWKILLKGLICYQITFFFSCYFRSCCASIFWKAKEKSVIMNGVSFSLAEWAWTTHIPTLLRGCRRGPGTSYAGWMTYLRKLHSSFPFTTAVP